MRHVLASTFACAALCSALLTTHARAAGIASLDVAKLETDSRVFAALNDKVTAFAERLRGEYTARKAFPTLALEDAETAAELLARSRREGARITDQELTQLRAYQASEQQRAERYLELITKLQGDMTEAEDAECKELQAAKTANMAAVADLEASLDKRYGTFHEKVRSQVQDRVLAIIQRSCEEAGAGVCLRTTVELWVPTYDERGMFAQQVPFVHWGGRDITDAVVRQLDETDLDRLVDDIEKELRDGAGEAGPAQPAGIAAAHLDLNGSEPMKLAGTLTASLPLVLATLSTAVQAQSVAYVDVYRVQAEAAPFVQVQTQLNDVRTEKDEEYSVHSALIFLSAEDAQAAAELRLLQMKPGAQLDEAQQTKLQDLLAKNSANETEFYTLVSLPAAQITADQQKRLDELTALRTARTTAVETMATKLMQEMMERENELLSGMRDKLKAAIESACTQAGATICLQNALLVYEPMEEGGFRRNVIPLVQWGGTDLTDKVIEALGQ